MLPAVVQVKAPVGIKVIVPPVAEIGAGAVMVTIAAVPEIIVTGAVGATVAAEAIVVATAVLAIKPETSDVALAAPKTGVTITMLVLVQAEILPLVTVPKTGVTKALLVNKFVIESCLVVLVAACTIGNTSALACPAATGNEEIAMVVIIDP